MQHSVYKRKLRDGPQKSRKHPSMEPTGDQDLGWRTATVLIYLLSGSAISWCLARRSFFRFRKRQRSRATKLSSNHSISFVRRSGRESAVHHTIGSALLQIPQSRNADKPKFSVSCLYYPTTTCARLTVFLTLSTSLLFVMSSAVLVLGVGLDVNAVDIPPDTGISKKSTTLGLPCRAVVYICLVSYGLVKIWIYLFLVERVYLALSSPNAPPRFSTRTYHIGSVGLIFYIVIIIFLLINHTSSLSMDGVALDQGIQRCMIGVRLCELIALLLYDSTVNITLTAFFVVSITQGHSAKRLPSILKLLQRRKASTKPQAHRYTLSLPTGYNASDMSLQPICTRFSDRRSDVEGSLANDLDQESTASEFELDDIQTSSLFCLAFRSFIVCLVGVTTSVVNLSVLMAHNGQETGTTFLRWCLIDVVINAVVISAVMQGRKEWWSDDDHDAVHPPA